MTRLAYILSPSHSGSTLLAMLLNSHPDVATVGELAPSHIGDSSLYRCSCGSLIRDCRFWQNIACSARARAVEFCFEDFQTGFSMPDSPIATRLLRPLHRGPTLELLRDVGLTLFSRWPSRVTGIMHANEVLVDVILRYYRALLFVDKGNLALRLKYLLHIPSFDVKVIRLIRDGRAVALTYMDPGEFADARDARMRDGGRGGLWKGLRLSMAQAAYQWRRCNEEAEHVLRRLDKSKWIEVRYEDMCKNAEVVLERLFKFLDLDPHSWAKDFRVVENHVVGNGMRLDSTSEIALDERWRTTLTKEDLRAFDREAGELNRRYGYQ